MVDNTTSIAASLRKIAKKLRTDGEQVAKAKQEKCAHILVAAHGLAQLQKRILEGPNG